MGTMNEILENSQEAEGNMEALQSESQMQGLMDSEITRRGQLLAKDRVMTLKIMERDNMTEQDRAVGVKEGAGFKDF